MPWDRSTPSDPKYRSKEHRDYRASLVRQLKRDGYLLCTAAVCVFDTRTITNANGRARDGLHAGHNDAGTAYDGPQHNACNVKDGARRARSKQQRAPRRWDVSTAPEPWLVQDDHPCPVCQAPVLWASQRCCSKGCASAYQRSNQAPKPRPEYTCDVCAAVFTGRKRRYCGDACMWEANARNARDRHRLSAGLPVDPTAPTVPRSPRGASF